MSSLRLITTHDLAADPRRQHRINANSFQQDALLHYQGWQYTCFYSESDTTSNEESDGDPALVVNISRRSIGSIISGDTRWETLTLPDYSQVVDDGHNTISLGICHGDGTIHVSFDHHCNELRFRVSQPGLAHDPAAYSWKPALFGPVHHVLPGADFPDGIFSEVTYPRFLSVDRDLLLSYRIGQAGSGSEVLFKYSSHTKQYSYLGQFLTGAASSPYINGISYSAGRVHASGCFRKFVDYKGAGDPNSTAHKANAGPNGPENNCHLFYTFSDDAGETWKNTNHNPLASLSGGGTVLPNARAFVVFDIPVNNGILNQEGQAAGEAGDFHALNRENEVWVHYYRDPEGRWSRNPVPGLKPSRTGNRGSVGVFRGTVYFALPGNFDDTLTILETRMMHSGALSPYNTVWQGDGFDGEPHIDIVEGGETGVVTIFTRTAASPRKVVVLDFAL